MYRTVKAVAARLREKWGVEMDLWVVASNVKRLMKDERVIPLTKQLVVKTVDNFNVNLGNDIFKIFGVVQLDAPPVLTSGTIRIGDIIFPQQTVWASDDSNATEITSEELEALNVLPYFRGPYIPYEYEAPYLRFNTDQMEVAILYSAIATDDNDMVYIPEDMVEALADYCAEVALKPQFYLGKVPLAVYKQVQEEANQAFGNGKWNMLMRGLSQNHINELLDIMTSMDRKTYGVNS